jgi:putative ABC transport system permease protein
MRSRTLESLPGYDSSKDDLVGGIGDTLWVLMGTVGIVLSIARANVANLLLVRADGCRQELAIRATLGAGFGRIARELLLESLLLALRGAWSGWRLLMPPCECSWPLN